MRKKNINYQYPILNDKDIVKKDFFSVENSALYSNFLSYYGIIKDNDTGWLIIWGVATSNGNIETYGGNSLSIYDDKLKFVRYVELTNVKDVMFMDKLFPIEIIYDINLLTLSDGNFIVCEVGFNKEWLAKFKYDITSGLFGEIVSISRL